MRAASSSSSGSAAASRASACVMADVSAGEKYVASSPQIQWKTSMSETARRAPATIASTSGRPKPSARLGKTTPREAA